MISECEYCKHFTIHKQDCESLYKWDGGMQLAFAMAWGQVGMAHASLHYDEGDSYAYDCALELAKY